MDDRYLSIGMKTLSGPESPTFPQAVCCFSNPKRERGRKRGPRSRFGLRFTPLFRENRLSQQAASGRVILDRNSCTNREAARESKQRVR